MNQLDKNDRNLTEFDSFDRVKNEILLDSNEFSDNDNFEHFEPEPLKVTKILKRPLLNSFESSKIDYPDSILSPDPDPNHLSDTPSLKNLDTQSITSKTVSSVMSVAESVHELKQQCETFDGEIETMSEWIGFDLDFKTNRPHVLIKLHPDLPEQLQLLDSGSWNNVISLDTLESIQELSNQAFEIKPLTLRLTSHSGHVIPVVGSVQFPIYIKDQTGVERTFTLTWVVTGDSQNCLIGCNFLMSYNAKLHFDAEALEDPDTFKGSLMFHQNIFNKQHAKVEIPEAKPIKFRLQPTKPVNILPTKTMMVQCNVIALDYHEEAKLKDSHALVKFEQFAPDGDEEVIAHIDSELRTTVCLKNDHQIVGIMLDEQFCVGTGSTLSSSSDEIVAEVNHSVDAYIHGNQIDTFQSKLCFCKDTNPETIPIFLTSQTGGTDFSFHSLSTHLSQAPHVRHYMIRRTQQQGYELFIRPGRLTTAICKSILSQLPEQSKLVAVKPPQGFSLEDTATLLSLKQQCMDKFSFSAGIFNICDLHQPLDMKPKNNTVVYFAFEDTKREMRPFVKDLKFKRIAKVDGIGRIYRNSKTNTNLIWVKVPHTLRLKEQGIRSCVRQTLHAVYLNNPDTLVTLFVDPKFSSFSLQAALNKEVSLTKLRILAYPDVKESLDRDNILIGKDLECIFQIESPVKVLDLHDSTKTNYANQISSLLEFGKTLPDHTKLTKTDNFAIPNVLTKKGYNEALRIGRNFVPDEKFKQFLAEQDSDDGEANFPQEARDDRSVLSEKTLIEMESALPEKGPNAKPEFESWRQLKKTPFDDGSYTQEQEAFYSSLMDEYNDVFAMGPHHLRMIKTDPLDIEIQATHLIRKPFPMSKRDETILHKILYQLVGEGFLKPVLSSPFTNPVFLVAKSSKIKTMTKEELDKLIESGDLRSVYRVVSDFSLLNKYVFDGSSELPSIEDIIDSMQGHQVFMIADLASYFHNLPISNKLKQACTVIAPPNLCFEPQSLLEGLKTGPIYSSIVASQMAKKVKPYCRMFVDDWIVFGDSIESIRSRTRDFFEDMRTSNGLVNSGKIRFEQHDSFTFLGYHFAVKNGILEYQPTSQRYKIFSQIEISDLASIQSFLGFVAYNSQFAASLASLCSPLFSLLALHADKPRKFVPQLEPIHIEVFNKLKTKMCNLESLVVPGIGRDLVICTDGNSLSYGGVILMAVDNTYRICCYHSRRFSPSFARSNSSLSREAAALMHICLRFKHRIFAAKSCTVLSDCRALLAILKLGTSHNSNVVTPARWIMVVSQLPLCFLHCPRTALGGPDFLGRLGIDLEIIGDKKYCEYSYKKMRLCEVAKNLIKEGQKYSMNDLQIISETNDDFFNKHDVCPECQNDEKVEEPSLPEIENSEPEFEPADQEIEDFINEIQHPTNLYQTCSALTIQSNNSMQSQRSSIYSLEKLVDAQQALPSVRKIVHILQTQDPVPPKYKKYGLLNGTILVRKKQKDRGLKRDNVLLYVPQPLIVKMICEMHYVAHANATKIHQMLSTYYFSESMRTICRDLVNACKFCALNKVLTFPSIPIGVLRPSSKLWDQIFIDYVHMKPTKYKGKTYSYILTLLDHFSFMGFSYMCQTMTTTEFLDKMDNFLTVVQNCAMVTGDNQISLLKNDQARAYFEEKGIEIRNTLAYNSKSNPVEIFNRCLRQILKLLCQNQDKNWTKHLQTSTLLINSTPHSWRDKRLHSKTPLQIAFNNHPTWSPYEDIDDPNTSVEVRETLRKLIVYLQDQRFQANQDLIAARMTSSRIQKNSLCFVKKHDRERKSKQETHYHPEIYRVLSTDTQHGVWISPQQSPHLKYRTHVRYLKPIGVLSRRIYEQLSDHQKELFDLVEDPSDQTNPGEESATATDSDSDGEGGDDQDGDDNNLQAPSLAQPAVRSNSPAPNPQATPSQSPNYPIPVPDMTDFATPDNVSLSNQPNDSFPQSQQHSDFDNDRGAAAKPIKKVKRKSPWTKLKNVFGNVRQDLRKTLKFLNDDSDQNSQDHSNVQNQTDQATASNSEDLAQDQDQDSQQDNERQDVSTQVSSSDEQTANDQSSSDDEVEDTGPRRTRRQTQRHNYARMHTQGF